MFKWLEGAEHIRALVLSGSGRAFCAGADLSGSGSAEDSPQGVSPGGNIAYGMDVRFNPVTAALYRCKVPTLAVVNGACAGGGVGLALACDVVICSSNAYFQLTFVPKLGLAPDLGSTWILPRCVGRARALGLSLLGSKVQGDEAERIGLVWRCVPQSELQTVGEEIAAALARLPLAAVIETRQLVDASMKGSVERSLELERRAQRRLGDSDDFTEGLAAFAQKRKPQFGHARL